MATMTANLDTANGRPRCTEPGCPVRYRGGPNRPCPIHQDEVDELATLMAEYDVAMAAPGEQRADTDGGHGDGDQ
jgi:hypothetical protein